MNTFFDEIRELRNPGLCAYLLWRHAIGYQKGNEEQASVPSILMFYVLPLLLHRDIADIICITQLASGLRKALAKVKRGGKSSLDSIGPDILLGVDDAVVDFRELTCKAMFAAEQSRLLTFSDDRQRCVGLDANVVLPSLPESVERLGAGAAKLGAWFARLSVEEITQALKVEL